MQGLAVLAYVALVYTQLIYVVLPSEIEVGSPPNKFCDICNCKAGYPQVSLPATQRFHKQYINVACGDLSQVICPLPIDVDAYYCTQCNHAAYYSASGRCSSGHFQISPSYIQGPSLDGKRVDIPACSTAPQRH
ncbi:hypothetical protein PGT21_015039 [Puccinia graminis f. sp. tritici]|uniref:Uncharacterized protein n=1 Tax=Puccinia graminis f. sp. tritici TaxID=56615 RepID=A0A5B0SE75_PUCGR|nr:hypothetical protein PGT21_015039 [Puccinia graminis f. sp. tritici]KAA1136092.1 hypothetical protein PGTUg99_028550 [Puccinia graminis f. sp. tritici]